MEGICHIDHSQLSDEQRMAHAGVRPTAMRLLIYRSLCNSPRPLSSLEIETILETVDRSTISRTLATFLEHDLIHSIDDGSSSIKYEVCKSSHHHSINDLHVHFHCSACEKTFCLPTLVPKIDMPEGFVAQGLNYVVSGLCDKCAAKQL